MELSGTFVATLDDGTEAEFPWYRTGFAEKTQKREYFATLPEGSPAGSAEPAPRLIIDLEALGNVPHEMAGPLSRYASAIQAQRGDYNGRVLSIRQDDLRTLAVIYDESPSVLTDRLVGWGVLNAEGRPEGL